MRPKTKQTAPRRPEGYPKRSKTDAVNRSPKARRRRKKRLIKGS